MEIEIVIAVIMLLALVLLATVDMAFSRLSDVSLRRLASDTEGGENRRAEMLREMLENRPRYRFALSAAIQILLIIYAVILTLLLLRFVEDRTRLLIVALVTGLASTVIFRQIIPRLVVANDPDKRLLLLLPLVGPLFSLVSKLAAPFDDRMTAKERLKLELTAAPDSSDEKDEDSADDFQALMEVGEAEGIIEEKEREMIETMVEFGDTRAGEIMTPRTGIIAVQANTLIKDARDVMIEEKYSRLPIYSDTIDNIEGMVYVRDLLAALATGRKEEPVENIKRDAYFVPETITAAELLKTMQANHVQIAVVIDEYGGVAGLVTVEDIIEEIVGEIEDEDTEQEEIIEIVEGDDGYWDVLGSTEIFKIERIFDNADLEDEDYTTIAGMVTTEAGYVPKQGEKLELRGLSVEILRADEKRIHLLRLRKLEDNSEATDSSE
ncbi:MAG: hemolysin family protein [Pyrinomonadaceae bacterium]